MMQEDDEAKGACLKSIIISIDEIRDEEPNNDIAEKECDPTYQMVGNQQRITTTNQDNIRGSLQA